MIGISTLEYANSLIHAVLIKEQKILIKLLRERVDSAVKVRAGFGSNSRSNIYLENDMLSMNDYRNYLWICVKKGNERHWLTLFYNDVDEKSGNFHTQFGRIQFWKDVVHNYNATEIVNGFLEFINIENKFEQEGESGNNDPTEKEDAYNSSCIDFSNCVNCCMGNRNQLDGEETNR